MTSQPGKINNIYYLTKLDVHRIYLNQGKGRKGRVLILVVKLQAYSYADAQSRQDKLRTRHSIFSLSSSLIESVLHHRPYGTSGLRNICYCGGCLFLCFTHTIKNYKIF